MRPSGPQTAVVPARTRAIVEADEFQFLISGGGQPLTVDAGNLDQVLVLPEEPLSISVLTGAHWGPVEVRVACL